MYNKTIQNITLTDEQYNELAEVIIDNLSETLSTSLKAKDEWWKKLLGWYPYRVDRLKDKTFTIYPDPE
jgi:hypothetical protein